jgi:hypothetical protein
MMIGGALGLVGNALGSSVGSGLGSMLNGGGAVATGISMLAYGPIGWVGGGLMMLLGAGTAIMGANEVYSGITGDTTMRDWMGGGLYDGLYLGLNIASAVGQIAGHMYMNSMAGQRAYAYQNINKYGYTDTVMGKTGRPYTYDRNVQKMIIKNGKMSAYVPKETSIFYKTGHNYMFKYGKWEITVSNPQKMIMHFLHRGSLRGIYPF